MRTDRADALGWLTVAVRPAGELDHAAALHLVALLEQAEHADLLLLDVTAVQHLGSDVLLALEDCARRLRRTGRALVVVHATGALAAVVQQHAPSAVHLWDLR